MTYIVDEFNRISLYGTCSCDGTPLDIRLRADKPQCYRIERYCPVCLAVQ